MEASEGAMTPMLQQAIRAARELPEVEQDALAAAILEWIDEQRRWAESFARTHDALAELARAALSEHHAGQTPDFDSAYADMAADHSREAEAVEWSEGSIADAADEDDEPRLAADG